MTKMLLAAAVLATATGARPETAAARVKKSSETKSRLVQRGNYLVQLGGCNHCHTPWKMNEQFKMPMPDMSRMLSGHPSDAPDPAGKYAAPDIGIIGPTFTNFAMPFGIVYSANLTPDDDTGLGSWTEKMFIDAMRTGRHLGHPTARPIFPPMPWEDMKNLTDQDLKAIFAYLRSIPAIKNGVPAHKVPEEVVEQMTQTADRMQASMQQGKASGHHR